MKKILLTATVQSHIAQFHLPLIKLLKQQGFEVHVAAKDNLSEKNGLEISGADKIFDIPFTRSPFNSSNFNAYFKLKKILSNTSYDFIHCNTPMGGVITRILAKRARKNGAKVFYTAHGFHFYRGAPLKSWIIYYPIEKWLAKKTDKLITITREDYKIAAENFKTQSFHTHGVGVNTDKYYPIEISSIKKLRKEMGYRKDDTIILCVGELNKNKNQQTIIKALAEVVKTNSNIKLLLAGNGPMKRKLMNMVTVLELGDKVEFLGYKRDLEKYVNICDLVVSASFREGLPLNIMEAMRCGKPIIASKNRGHNELIENGENGYLINADDVEGFTSKILELNKNISLRKKLGDTGKEKVKPFSEENVSNELKRIYNIL